MNPGRFFLPRMSSSIGPMMRTSYLPAVRNIGLFGRLTNSLKTFNWGGLLNGANKTLNVVNQTIPLVRQAGPMLNNMKSMLRIAKIFGNETNNVNKHNRNTKILNNNNNATGDIHLTSEDNNSNIKKEVIEDNYPNFFI